MTEDLRELARRVGLSEEVRGNARKYEPERDPSDDFTEAELEFLRIAREKDGI